MDITEAEAKALHDLHAHLSAHRDPDPAKRKEFGLDAAQAFYDSLPPDPLAVSWKRIYGRAPREKGSMYPVRTFGGRAVTGNGWMFASLGIMSASSSPTYRAACVVFLDAPKTPPADPPKTPSKTK
jgi:hypothetical protein